MDYENKNKHLDCRYERNLVSAFLLQKNENKGGMLMTQKQFDTAITA